MIASVVGMAWGRRQLRSPARRGTDAALNALMWLCGGAGEPDRMVVEHTSLSSAGTVAVWQGTALVNSKSLSEVPGSRGH